MTQTRLPSRAARPALVPTLAAVLAMVLLAVVAAPVAAQSPFAAAARVNNAIVTNYEVSQRQRLLEILNAPPEARAAALETLIDERLQAAEAARLGAAATPEQIETALEEFAARVGMGAEQFVRTLGEQGVAPETLRDFVAAGASWRNVIRGRFGQQARVTEAEIDRALATGNFTTGQRVLIAELIVPVSPENAEEIAGQLRLLAERIGTSRDLFSEAARRFSVAQTREEGGLTGWRALSSLPGPLQGLFASMEVGEVTDPIPLGPALALFQLRGLEEVTARAAAVASVDYLTIAIPGGRSAAALAEAARLRDAVDTCDDLYGVLPGGFERQSAPVSQIPDDIAVVLSRLDDNEMATDLTRGDGTVLLVTMLCGRSYASGEEQRQQVEQMLIAQRMEGYATAYLAELRADAIITYE